MNGVALVIFAIEVITVVVGQILLKHAMDQAKELGGRSPKVIALFTGGVTGMAISFFLTLALLQHFDLSYFFPFQASSTVLIVASAVVFLRERLSPQLAVGTLLIAAGIVLVSLS